MSEDNRHHILIPIAAGIFTSAWLLFQVQPMIARHILPWYGGGASVWTTCMMFFQVFLLAGYAYAHLLARWLDPARQVVIHLSLLTLSLLLLPITPAESLQPDGTGNPMAGILVLLTLTVGFPYLMVSASGPLLQHWFTRAAPGQSPYRLYALSNAGSLIGLLSYPFVVEPVLTLTAQSYLWSGRIRALCRPVYLGSFDAVADTETAAGNARSGRCWPHGYRAPGDVDCARWLWIADPALRHQSALSGRRRRTIFVGRAAVALPDLIHPLFRLPQVVPALDLDAFLRSDAGPARRFAAPRLR